MHSLEREGDAAFQNKEYRVAENRYREAMTSRELLRDEMVRIGDKRKAVAKASAEAAGAILAQAPKAEFSGTLRSVLFPVFDAPTLVADVDLEAMSETLLSLVANRGDELSEEIGTLLRLRSELSGRVSTKIVHGWDEVIVKAALSLPDENGKPHRLAEVREILREEGAKDERLVELSRDLESVVEKLFPKAEALANEGKPTAALQTLLELTVDLPAGHPVRARATALRERLAAPYLKSAEQSGIQPETKLLRLGIARVFLGDTPQGYRSLYRELAEQNKVQWEISGKIDGSCAESVRTKILKALPKGEKKANTLGQVTFVIDECKLSENVEEVVTRKPVRVTRSGPSTSTSCVDAMGGSASCASSGTVYRQTTITPGQSSVEYEEVRSYKVSHVVSIRGSAKARVDGAEKSVSFSESAKAENNYPQGLSREELARLDAERTQKVSQNPFNREGQTIAMAWGEIERKAIDKVLEARSAVYKQRWEKARARYEAGPQSGEGAETNFVIASLSGVVVKTDRAAAITSMHNVGREILDAALSEGETFGPAPVQPTKQRVLSEPVSRSAASVHFAESDVLDPQKGTHTQLYLGVLNTQIPNVLADPDRSGFAARIAVSAPLLGSIFEPHGFVIDDLAQVRLALGSRSGAGATPDEKSTLADFGVSYRIMLSYQTPHWRAGFGFEPGLRFFGLGDVSMGGFVLPLALSLHYRLAGSSFVHLSLWGVNVLDVQDRAMLGAQLRVPFGRSPFGLLLRGEQWREAVLASVPFGADPDDQTRSAGRQVATMLEGGISYAF